MAGVAFEALPAGARDEWLKETDRRAHDSLYVGDIAGARSGRRGALKSTRHYNDPQNPTYQLPSCPPPEPVNLHARTQQPLGPARDSSLNVSDINMKKVNPFSAFSGKPARDNMSVADVPGANSHAGIKHIDKGYDSMQVQEINFEGLFKTSRHGHDPLDPKYNYDPDTNTSWDIPGGKPAGFKKQSNNCDLKLRTSDIAGCQADKLTLKTRSMRTRQVMRTDDIDKAQANTVDKCMRTTRCVNPLAPVYKPLASQPGTPVTEWREPTPVATSSFEPTRIETISPNTQARNDQKRLAKVQQDVRDKVTQRTVNMRDAFIKFDSNFDGTVNYQEFRDGLEHGLGCALPTPDYEMLVKHVDADGSGQIDYFEFANKMKERDIEAFQGDDTQQKMRQGEGRGGRIQHASTGALGSMALEQAGGIWRTKTPEPLKPGQELTEAERVDRALDVKLKRAIENKSGQMLQEFRTFDDDGDANLTYPELRRGMEKLEVPFSDPEFDRLCQRLDADGTGYVDYGEFARYMQAGELQNRGHHATVGLGAIAGGQLAAERQGGAAQKAMEARGGGVQILSAEEQEDVKLHKLIWEKAGGKGRHLRRLFATFDDNSDGTVSYPEFRRGLEHGLNVGLTDGQMQRLLQKVDADNSGKIDYLEFAQQMKPKEFTGAHDIDADRRRAAAAKANKGKASNNGTPASRSGRMSSSGRLTSGERLRRAREREETKYEIESVRSLPDHDLS